MIKQYLAVLATSATVERRFSSVGLVKSYWKGSLLDTTTLEGGDKNIVWEYFEGGLPPCMLSFTLLQQQEPLKDPAQAPAHRAGPLEP